MCDGNNLILSSSWQYLRKYLSWQYLGKYLSGKYLYFQYIGSSSLPSSPSLGLHVWSTLPGKVCLIMTLIDNGADYNHPVLLTTTVQTDAKYLFFRQDWTWDVSPFETGYCRGRKNISKLSFDWCLIQKHENLNWNADQPTQIQERFYTLPSGWKLKVLGSTINWDDKCHHHILITQLSIPATKKFNTKQLRTMALYWQKK